MTPPQSPQPHSPQPKGATGIWRPAPEAQRRDVAVVIEHGALVLRDPRGGAVLAHWALAATERRNPGAFPALFAPQGDDEGEVLELADPTLTAAIERTCARIRARRPRPGRLRLATLGVVGAAVALLLTLWFPAALVNHAAGLVPPVKRAEIGRMALADVARLSGTPCGVASPGSVGPGSASPGSASPGSAARALARLSERLFGPGGGQIVILREGLASVGRAAHLPGGLVLLDRALIEDFDTPEVAAGHALAERLRAEMHDPLLWLLRAAGVAATGRLLTTGVLPEAALAGIGQQVLTTPPEPLPAATLMARFAAAGLRPGPYAAAQPDAALHDALMAEAAGVTLAPRLLLPDADWVALQGICDG